MNCRIDANGTERRWSYLLAYIKILKMKMATNKLPLPTF